MCLWTTFLKYLKILECFISDVFFGTFFIPGKLNLQKFKGLGPISSVTNKF